MSILAVCIYDHSKKLQYKRTDGSSLGHALTPRCQQELNKLTFGKEYFSEYRYENYVFMAQLSDTNTYCLFVTPDTSVAEQQSYLNEIKKAFTEKNVLTISKIINASHIKKSESLVNRTSELSTEMPIFQARTKSKSSFSLKNLFICHSKPKRSNTSENDILLDQHRP